MIISIDNNSTLKITIFSPNKNLYLKRVKIEGRERPGAIPALSNESEL
jgi:hypothetical protein